MTKAITCKKGGKAITCKKGEKLLVTLITRRTVLNHSPLSIIQQSFSRLSIDTNISLQSIQMHNTVFIKYQVQSNEIEN
uniref:Uncharacterized protein n=1 Tax=Arundo donax TaxID=35708 RepID=A0A0A8Z0B5_ARUDO